MKCEWVRQNIFLYVYDELTDDARFELERHLERCTDCAAELKKTLKEQPGSVFSINRRTMPR